ncbi:MAG: ABC transporter substrate-binding protein, partial [Anaerolineae bacterium]|nr:ABC transporter substrate-binding protein [Anaerolineae bacterium]
MARKFVFLFLLLLVLAPVAVVSAQPSGLPVDVPREELFVADQIYRFSGGIGNYNLWASGDTPHRHALMMETLWLRDMETGERINDAADAGPVYNEDF